MIDVSLTARVTFCKSYKESVIKCIGKFIFCHSFRLITEALQSRASTVYGSSNTMDPLFNPTHGMDSAPCYSMFVLSVCAEALQLSVLCPRIRIHCPYN